MNFYCKDKDLVVISRKTKKEIARFVDGKFETEDTELIVKLKPHFKNDGIDYKSLNYMKLLKMAKAKDIPIHKKKKVFLVEALERSEING